MWYASSAARTCGANRSGSEYTAIVRIPRSRADLTIRTAISPRLATKRERIKEFVESERDRSSMFYTILTKTCK